MELLPNLWVGGATAFDSIHHHVTLLLSLSVILVVVAFRILPNDRRNYLSYVPMPVRHQLFSHSKLLCVFIAVDFRLVPRGFGVMRKLYFSEAQAQVNRKHVSRRIDLKEVCTAYKDWLEHFQSSVIRFKGAFFVSANPV